MRMKRIRKKVTPLPWVVMIKETVMANPKRLKVP